MSKITLSVIKADIGSIGGHTKPSKQMLEKVSNKIKKAIKENLLIDGLATFTGDDIALLMSHIHGIDAKKIHLFAWNCFLEATKEAQKLGLYGAGQDLLVDSPAGTVRGAGPAVAEIEFERNNKNRPAEAFLVFTADKCGPGSYNYPFYSVFCDPMHNGGILLNPKMRNGFTVTIVDMDYKEKERIIKLNIPERIWDIAVLLQNPDRFAIKAIYSRFDKTEQIASVSATRLHNIAGKYVGKDDPVAIVRTQGMFPAPEEVIEPFMFGHFVTGGARGSHVMPLMPVPINTPVTGPYCLPLVACLAFSMNKEGAFSSEYVDMFNNPVWDSTRLKIGQKAEEWRREGFIGPTMASHAELSYTGIVDALTSLEKEFVIEN
jgi:fructose 1,6-bisphosphate aldolase/phosphatase